MRTRLAKWNEQLKSHGHTYMVGIAVVVGILGGLGAVGFRYLIEGLQELFWGGAPTLAWLSEQPAYLIVLIPTLGGLAVGLLVHIGAPEAKGHGVPEVMEAVALRGGRIRPRVVAVKTLASGICIASGGSVGREGPIVQIGSALASSIGQFLRLGTRRLRTIAGCGAAAGIAATFNAPIAGVLFAVEVLLRDLRLSQFSTLVVAAVMATAVSRELLGNVPAFAIPHYSMVSPWELGAYAVLGLLAGVLAIAFVRVLYASEDRLERLRIWPPLLTALGGAALGGLALATPEIMGNGYESIETALLHTPSWRWLVWMAVAKGIAVCLTLGTGGSGGVFAPSLFLGAMAGGLVGVLANALFPGSVGAVGAYALVGMGAVVAATTHAPLTAIIILFELTGDYRIILPLMIACTLATLMATWSSSESIYTLKLSRRGMKLHQGRDVNVLKDVRVRRLVRPLGESIPASLPALELLALVAARGDPAYLVCGPAGECLGVVSLEGLRPVLANPGTAAMCVAADLADPLGAELAIDDTLDTALTLMQRAHLSVQPVTERGEVVGWVCLDDILESYRSEVFKRDMVQGMADAFQPNEGAFFAAGDVVVREGEVPHAFDGKSLGELEVRKRFGVTVLVVKRTIDGVEEVRVPDVDTVLRAGDRILALGAKADIHRALSD